MAFVFRARKSGSSGSWTDLCPDKIIHEGIKYTREKVWSDNTRRNSSAKMTGTIKAIKLTLDVSYSYKLTPTELSRIKSVVDSDTEWWDVQITNEVGTVETHTMYFGNPSYEPYWFVNGKMMYKSISIQAVER